MLSCQFPIAYAVRHQQKVIASRHEFDTYPLSSTKCLLALIHSRASRHFVIQVCHFGLRAWEFTVSTQQPWSERFGAREGWGFKVCVV